MQRLGEIQAGHLPFAQIAFVEYSLCKWGRSPCGQVSTPGLSRARVRSGAERMNEVEREGVDKNSLRGYEGRRFGIAPRRRIDGERVGTVAR